MYRQCFTLTGNEGTGGIEIGRIAYSPKLGGSFDILMFRALVMNAFLVYAGNFSVVAKNLQLLSYRSIT